MPTSEAKRSREPPLRSGGEKGIRAKGSGGMRDSREPKRQRPTSGLPLGVRQPVRPENRCTRRAPRYKLEEASAVKRRAAGRTSGVPPDASDSPEERQRRLPPT